ncbi:TIGR02391 family protein [Sagittula sp. NFXS13]|uniref:TIGR02391 family protein n=1 Tax=Sagittula sp. NFXS13 TaxID=2819095 RepID=UPI0032DF9244
MTIGNPTRWLAKVSNKCRRMMELSVVAVRDAETLAVGSRGTLEATKSALEAIFPDLLELLPGDFPASRVNDLGRHIHFCQINDCIDIAAFDIPDILEKAEVYAQEHIPETPSGEIGDYLHPLYRARLDREILIADPDFHGLVAKACIMLGDAFKYKAGAVDDQDSEIGRAFKVDSPKIKVLPELESSTAKNFQRGTMLLLQGVRAFYRNTHLHGQISTTKRQAIHALIIMSMLNEILDAAQTVGSEDA